MKEEVNKMENYKITLEDAKKMGIYKFKKELCYCKEEILDVIINNKQLRKNQCISDNILDIVQFGNIDIELTVHNCDGVLDIGYFVCAKYKEIGWESVDYAYKDFELEDIDNIEEVMFNAMMEFAEINNLHWSKLN